MLSARNYALDLLARREHTELELKNKLLVKKFDSDEIIKVIQTLQTQGLQSDARFLESYVSMRSRRGFGPIRIKAELIERGINKTLINESEAFNSLNWKELAENIICKKFGVEQPTSFQDKVKQKQYLYYKGF
jgi:regulatory protein